MLKSSLSNEINYENLIVGCFLCTSRITFWYINCNVRHALPSLWNSNPFQQSCANFK